MFIESVTNVPGHRTFVLNLLHLASEDFLERFRSLNEEREVNALLRLERRLPEVVVVSERLLRFDRVDGIERLTAARHLDLASPEKSDNQKPNRVELPAEGFAP